MKRVITRKQIIKALQTEPLRAGNWISSSSETYTWYHLAKRTKCTVCAVGGVLRSSLGNELTCNQIASFGVNLALNEEAISPFVTEARQLFSKKDLKAIFLDGKKRLKKYSQLTVLSYVFESVYQAYGLDRCRTSGRGPKMRALRNSMVKFVEANYPTKTLITIE